MARSGWVKPVSERRLSDLLTRVFPAGVVDEVIAIAGRSEVRHRALPARVMAYFSIGMALYSEDSYEDVFAQLTDGLSWSSGWAEFFGRPAPGRGEKSAFPQARVVALAEDLAAASSERWEIENTFDELKTHQRGPRAVLRSKSLDLIL